GYGQTMNQGRQQRKGRDGFSKALLWCSMGGRERGPPSTYVVGGRFWAVHRDTVGQVIPWSGCVPAEPASVSPGEERLPGNGSARQARLWCRSGKVIVVGPLLGMRAIGNSKCRW